MKFWYLHTSKLLLVRTAVYESNRFHAIFLPALRVSLQNIFDISTILNRVSRLLLYRLVDLWRLWVEREHLKRFSTRGGDALLFEELVSRLVHTEKERALARVENCCQMKE